MKDIRVSVDGLRWYKPRGKHVDEIRLEETIDYALETEIASLTLLAFNRLGGYIWHDKLDPRFTAADRQLDRLKPVVEDLLVNAGWEVHIVDPLKDSEAEDYLHSTGGAIQVHQVPFSAEMNTELRRDELHNGDGKIRSKEETLALLKERIGVDAFDIRELSEEDRDYVLAIMRQEERGLEDLHDVDGQELTTGTQTFEWFRDDEEAEQEALDYLTDDPELWKMKVAADNTTDGLEEWAEDAIRIDGWAAVIGGYDGLERVAQLMDETWFPYIRTDQK